MPSHPLHKFRFCPVCGSAGFCATDARGKRCPQCGFQYYFNAASATVAVIVNEQGQLLSVRRAKEPAQGTRDLPGGFCDPGETAEQGVAREVAEETGLVVTHCQYLFSIPNVYPFSGLDVHTTDLFFLCRVEGGQQPRAMDDAASWEWLSPQRIIPHEFGLHSVRQGVVRLLSVWGELFSPLV